MSRARHPIGQQFLKQLSASPANSALRTANTHLTGTPWLPFAFFDFAFFDFVSLASASFFS